MLTKLHLYNDTDSMIVQLLKYSQNAALKITQSLKGSLIMLKLLNLKQGH